LGTGSGRFRLDQHKSANIALALGGLAALLAAFAIVPEGTPRAAVLILSGILLIAFALALNTHGWRRAGATGLALLSFLCIIVIWIAPQSVFERTSFSFDVDQSFTECSNEGYACEEGGSLKITSSNGELLAVGVNLKDLGSKASSGSAVVLVESDGDVRWRSPIHYFKPGFGLQSMSTDLTNHLFVEFAATNHSTILWIVDPAGPAVRDFGTMGGSGLAVSYYSDVTDGGVRKIYAPREGWPANLANPLTSRDVYKWNGDTYEFVGCEHFKPRGGEIIAFFRKGTPQCDVPVNKYSYDLSGERDPASPPP